MSKGFGVAQRFVLERLEQLDDWSGTYGLAWDRRAVEAGLDPESRQAEKLIAPPTIAEVESIRRAVRGLADRGLLDVRYRKLGTNEGPREFLEARLTPRSARG
jgi:hypothetical protein